MSNTETIRGYHREDGGQIEIVDLLVLDGAICDLGGFPLIRTTETATLAGWPDEGEAIVYRNGGGREILIVADTAMGVFLRKLAHQMIDQGMEDANAWSDDGLDNEIHGGETPPREATSADYVQLRQLLEDGS